MKTVINYSILINANGKTRYRMGDKLWSPCLVVIFPESKYPGSQEGCFDKNLQ